MVPRGEGCGRGRGRRPKATRLQLRAGEGVEGLDEGRHLMEVFGKVSLLTVWEADSG